MKGIIIIVLTFALAFLTSGLYDIEFVARNLVREILVTVLILIELIVGFYLVKGFFKAVT